MRTPAGAPPFRLRRPGVLLLLSALASPARPADLSGSSLVATTASTASSFRSDLLEQQYTLGLRQELTPYLTVRLGYQYFDLGTTFQDGTTFARGSSQPLVELLYDRDRLSGRVSLYQLSVHSTAAAENLDRRSLAANLSYEPARWPGFTANFRDDRNVADVSLFGRDVNSRLLG